MVGKTRKEAIRLINEVNNELDSSKGSLLVAIQKLSRVSIMIDNEELMTWCQIHLGDTQYSQSINDYVDALVKLNKDKSKSNKKHANELLAQLKEYGLNEDIHLVREEIAHIYSNSGKNKIFPGIGFIEEKYNDFVRSKKGNDGTFYKNNMLMYLTCIRKSTHSKANGIYKSLSLSDSPQSALDLLRGKVDDKLLDLNPQLAEMVMIMFQNISSDNEEMWSNALTTCRRFLENLADELLPARDEKFKGRSVGKQQYINRIWAYMDLMIESESNKELAKIHVDFLGNYMKSLYRLYNKGVHTSITRIESTKVVMHTYLMLADLLDYLEDNGDKEKQLDINNMSLDEIESVLNIKRTVAKEIIKCRVLEGGIDVYKFGEISGIGPKTLKKAIDLGLIQE